MRITEIEYTPNPNAVKFVLKEPITHVGTTRSFSEVEAAAGVPLAQHLLSLDHVLSVFFADRYITVTQDGSADWPDLLRELAKPIRSATLDDAGPDVQTSFAQEMPEGVELGQGLDDPRIPMIREVFDEQIMPFLAADGGGLEILGLVNDRLLIRYQGACGTCPSSLTGTLMAIENIVQMEVDPELEVLTL